MAAAIPAPLKTADIARFGLRAGQLEKAKPVVSYYCYYWMLEQIISKGLHNTDNECKTYTTNLMDKLEQMKVDYAEDNAITDDAAGHVYVEQFGQETFQRADKTMNANKVTRQTADTFQAAATFLDLVQIWGPLEPEIASKIKYAKYHALRIAKALKAGEDPNLSNPVPEPDPENEQPLDPNDPEVQAINGTDGLHDAARQPSVEEIPDEHDQAQRDLAQRSTANESLHPSRAPSVPPQTEQHRPLSPPIHNEGYHANGEPPDVSPLGPSSEDRRTSSGGGYFPNVPEHVGHAPILPSAPPTDPGSPPVQNLPDSSSLAPRSADSLHSFPPPDMGQTSDFTSPPTQPSLPPLAPSNAQQTFPQSSQHVPQAPFPSTLKGPTPNPMQHPVTQPSASAPYAASRPPAAPAAASQVFAADEEAILKAQKHARWAISALNFEDVKTAVQELRGALESLGAT